MTTQAKLLAQLAEAVSLQEQAVRREVEAKIKHEDAKRALAQVNAQVQYYILALQYYILALQKKGKKKPSTTEPSHGR